MFVLSLVACMAAGLGGEETDGIAGSDDVSTPAFANWETTSETATDVGDTSGTADSGSGGDTGEVLAIGLVANWTGEAIHCQHGPVISACSTPPAGGGWSTEGTTVNVRYAIYTDGDAPCAYTVDYDITGEFTSGTWTVRANGDEATVVVP
jgi:hypothetical protein